MANFKIDLSSLENTIDKKTYRFEDVKHNLTKVAFDIYRNKENADELWQVQSADDGEYIVARYEVEEPAQEKTASAKIWETILSSSTNEINIFYKNHPITKIALSKLGLKNDDAYMVKSLLPNKLASSPSLVKALMNTLSSEEKQYIFKSFPELSK